MPGKSKRRGEVPAVPQFGRPTLLTKKVHKQIIEAIEKDGMLEGRAALLAGIDDTTLSRWKARGRIAIKNWATFTPEQQAKELRFAEFFKALRDADPKFEQTNLRGIRKAAEAGDWRANDRRLAIKFPEIYGKRIMQGGDPKNPTPIPISNPGAKVVIYIPDNGRNPGLLKPPDAPAT